jgi:GntR family transcriptional regulator
VIHIVRLRLADGYPVAYEIRYLAQSLCPTILKENLTCDSIHWLLVRKYQIPLVKMTHAVELRPVTSEQAEKLQIETGTTAFFIDRLTFTEKDGKRYPAVWFQAIYREDVYRIEATALRSL